MPVLWVFSAAVSRASLAKLWATLGNEDLESGEISVWRELLVVLVLLLPGKPFVPISLIDFAKEDGGWIL